MDLCTMGRDIYPDLKIPVFSMETDEYSHFQKDEERFLIVFMERGSGIVNVGGHREIFIAPAAFCLNETEIPVFESGSNLKIRLLYFHPRYINSFFTFKNIREGSTDFRETDWHDRHLLRPFFERDNFYGRINLNIITAKKVSLLFDTFNNEISDQRDNYWPCRSRSFLIEIIFLIQEARLSPDTFERLVINNISEEISKILLFLYSNYHEKITIDLLTREFKINRTTLSDRFVREIGEPIMSFLVKLRITIAAIILRDSMIPVSEVIERVGFKDHAYFVKAFKKQLGCAPSDYRQLNSWLLR